MVVIPEKVRRQIPIRKIRRYRNWREIMNAVNSGHSPKLVEFRNGLIINAPSNSTIMEIIDEVMILRHYNPPGLDIGGDDVVVDVGANIGVFTVWAAKKTSAKVIAYEPFPDNVIFIKKNKSANQLSNIVINKAGVGGRNGKQKLFISSISAGHVMFDNTEDASSEYIEVPVVTLEKIFKENKLEKINFLKIDCEGMEGEIIKNTQDTLLRKIDKIAMEFHDNVSNPNHHGITKILKRNGFKVRSIEHATSPFGYLYANRM